MIDSFNLLLRKFICLIFSSFFLSCFFFFFIFFLVSYSRFLLTIIVGVFDVLLWHC